MTEIGGINYYNIEPDIILVEKQSETGELSWKVYSFQRKASTNERYQKIVMGTTDHIFNTRVDVENYVNGLSMDGYYQLAFSNISKARFNLLNKRGLIGQINEKTVIQTPSELLIQ